MYSQLTYYSFKLQELKIKKNKMPSGTLCSIDISGI